jgi:hypothetical protein
MPKKYTKEEFAAMLDKREYTEEITDEEEKLAKESGLLVIFGSSDDLLEFRGLFSEEVGAYEGTEAEITKGGIIKKCENEDCPNAVYAPEIYAVVRAEWAGDEGYSWFISASVPYAPFVIIETHDGGEEIEKYCRGIVIDERDLP